MNSTQSSRSAPLSRADTLWMALLGMYGGDSVHRRYGTSIPPEWSGAINTLSDLQLQRGLRRLLHSGKPHVPTLPEFIRLARSIGNDPDLGDEAPRPPPMRALPERVPESELWNRQGNTHLMAYVGRHAARFRPDGLWGPRGEPVTMILVRWKNEWASLMRQCAPDEVLDGGRSLWDNCMSQAEAEISALLVRREAS